MKERVKRYYKKRAKTYEDLDTPDSIVAGVRAIGIRDHIEIMGLKKEEFVLDVGCGQGRFLEPINSQARAVGIDFTLEMLEKARASGALLVRADAEHLPFKKEVFDVTHSAGLLGVFRSTKIIEEMARVSKSRGRIFISFPAASSLSGVVARILIPLGWNPTLLDYWYTKEQINSMIPPDIRVKEFHRLGFEPPFQRLFKNIRPTIIVRIFIIFERNLRDKPLFNLLGGRFFLEAVK
jgi:ubiquinone/menaquinone biosynthesis C-methylase UbiE